MARTKATPLRRDPSSEYISKADAHTASPSRSPRNLDKATNGNGDELLQGLLNGRIEKPKKAQKEAGALQFFVAVGGIYGSL